MTFLCLLVVTIYILLGFNTLLAWEAEHSADLSEKAIQWFNNYILMVFANSVTISKLLKASDFISLFEDRRSAWIL